MDKHCAAVKDWRRRRRRGGEGGASEEEWCLHLCFRGSDQCGGKYHHTLPSPPPTPTTIPPFDSSSLLSFHSALQNCFALYSAFYMGESSTVRRGRANPADWGSAASWVAFSNQAWSPTSPKDKPPIFHKQPTRAAGCCLHLATGPGLSRSIIPLFCIQQKEKWPL